jgi:tRNA (guanine26-N2/guanine27-N2)-dimethyltransferase
MTEKDFKPGFPTEIVEEGRGKFLVPKLAAFVKSPSDYAPSKAPVFYNPVMELNRDIAVLALQAYQRMVNHAVSVCEPLTGCGIRGVRFATEVNSVKKVVINDISERSCQIAKQNVHMNRLEKKVTVKHEDANLLLSKHSAPHKRFDAIDIDPFGSPVHYIDSTVRALRNHGLLALTATDMAPLCGVHPKACIRKYGGKPLRTEYCHELAVRLLAGCLATTAAKHEMSINVVFSHSADHYVRFYAFIEYGAKKADDSLKNMGYVLHCFKCFHRESVTGLSVIEHSGKCSECGSKLSVGGPMWLGKLFDKNFCDLMEIEAGHAKFRHEKRIEKTVALAKNEIDMPVGYFVIDKLCDALSLPVPSVKRVIEALRKEGFQTSPTCFNPKGVKTDASAAKMRELLQQMMNAESKNLI